MNPVFIRIAGGLGIAAVSAGTAFLATSTYYKRVMEDRISEEIAQFKEDYSRRQFGTSVPPKPDISEIRSDRSDEDMGSYEEPNVSREEFHDMLEVLDEEGYSSNEPIEVELATPEYVEPEENAAYHMIADNPSDDEDEPYVITFEDWSESEPGQDQEALIWYEEDEVLTTEHGEVIDSVEETIGDGVFFFGKGSRDQNVVYIRNPKLETDYEVFRKDGSYAELVHGIRQPGKTNYRMREDD